MVAHKQTTISLTNVKLGLYYDGHKVYHDGHSNKNVKNWRHTLRNRQIHNIVGQTSPSFVFGHHGLWNPPSNSQTFAGFPGCGQREGKLWVDRLTRKTVYMCCYIVGLPVSAVQLHVLRRLRSVCPRDNAFLSRVRVIPTNTQLIIFHITRLPWLDSLILTYRDNWQTWGCERICLPTQWRYMDKSLCRCFNCDVEINGRLEGLGKSVHPVLVLTKLKFKLFRCVKGKENLSVHFDMVFRRLRRTTDHWVGQTFIVDVISYSNMTEYS